MMNIFGCILKGLAPVAVNLGSQIIKTKFEENVLSEYRKQIFNEVVDGISIGVVNAIQSFPVDNNDSCVEISKQHNHRSTNLLPITDNSKYLFDIRNYQ